MTNQNGTPLLLPVDWSMEDIVEEATDTDTGIMEADRDYWENSKVQRLMRLMEEGDAED